MKKEQEEWTEKVFQSMKGSKRAIPRPELFKEIEEKISGASTRVIPLNLVRKYAAAVILLLLINISAIMVLNQNEKHSQMEIVAVDIYHESLGNSFKIY